MPVAAVPGSGWWARGAAILDPITHGPTALRAIERWRTRSALQPTYFPYGELVVSLTSYPPRFATLHLTLKCLLTQTLRPHAVILWVAEQDLALLPDEVTRLASEGLSIRACADLRSYKKIVPALESYRGAFIATADDDLYYDENWLQQLAARHSPGGHDVICHRGHEIRHDPWGRPLPYLAWRLNTGAAECANLFLTGCGGVLYPPGSLDNAATDRDGFMRFCPTNDDIWLYWMARRAGSAILKVPGRHRRHVWRGSQKQALLHVNVLYGANDRQIRAMTDAFGYPPGR